MSFYLVLDTITHRVIKFAESELSVNGKNTYLAQTLELPAKLTEANAWQFRYASGKLKFAPTEKTTVVGRNAVLRETKNQMRKTVVEQAQMEFGRKVPLTALAYIAALDASRKWLADQPLEPVELEFAPSKEYAAKFMAKHYDNLARAARIGKTMSRKLKQIDDARTAEALEKITP